MSVLRCAYIRRDDARAFVRAHHRHHRPPEGAVLHLGCWNGLDLVGVAFLGRPVSRVEQEAGAWEVTRVATLSPEQGGRNAGSALYSYARRIVQLLDPDARLLTYTLPEESGASLRGAGWREDGAVKGRDWAACSRRQQQGRLFDAGAQHPTCDKLRWVAP